MAIIITEANLHRFVLFNSVQLYRNKFFNNENLSVTPAHKYVMAFSKIC